MQPVIKTKDGMLQGTETENGYVFKAVPYAMPPIGKFRFEPPQPMEPWEGIRVCDHFPPMAIQKREDSDSFYVRQIYHVHAHQLHQ